MATTFRLGLSQPSITFYHIYLPTHQEEYLFGEVRGEHTELSPSGHIAADEWQQIAVSHQRDIELDLWAVLPNGVRAVIAVVNNDAKTSAVYSFGHSHHKPRALSSFVAGFKAAAAKRINLVRGIPGAPVWQRGYQEQRIDDVKTLERIRQLLATQAQAAGVVTHHYRQPINQSGHPVE
ncbi:MAG: hypothetical protein AAGI69_10955 [Cyanobacteria bacterium P01_H01_bin.21]